MKEVSVDVVELILNKEGAREWVALETEVVEALLSFAIRDIESSLSSPFAEIGDASAATRLWRAEEGAVLMDGEDVKLDKGDPELKLDEMVLLLGLALSDADEGYLGGTSGGCVVVTGGALAPGGKWNAEGAVVPEVAALARIAERNIAPDGVAGTEVSEERRTPNSVIPEEEAVLYMLSLLPVELERARLAAVTFVRMLPLLTVL